MTITIIKKNTSNGEEIHRTVWVTFEDWMKSTFEKFEGIPSDWNIKNTSQLFKSNGHYFGSSTEFIEGFEKKIHWYLDIEKKEEEKIKKKQQEIFEFHVTQNFIEYKDRFLKQYNDSYEKAELLEITTEEILKILKSKNFENGIGFIHGKITSFYSNDNIWGDPPKDKTLNPFQIEYESFVIRGIRNYSAIEPYFENNLDYCNNLIVAVTFYKYLNFLVNLKEEINPKKDTNRINKEDPSFLKLFRNNQVKMDNFLSLLKSLHFEALDEHNDWIFNSRKSSIVACFRALEELEIIKKLNNEAQLFRVVKTKIGFEGNIKLFRNQFNQDDYDSFYSKFNTYLK